MDALDTLKRGCCFPERKAFTMLELLLVMAIISVLGSITFAVGGSVRKSLDRRLALAQMSQLALALENYRSYYGDYPYLSSTKRNVYAQSTKRSAKEFFGLLTGAMAAEITETDSDSTVVVKDLVLPPGETPKSFIYLDKFTLATVGTKEFIVDPWGNPYEYYYKKGPKLGPSDEWNFSGFLLISMGPDGKMGYSDLDALRGALLRNDLLKGDLKVDNNAGVGAAFYFVGPNADNLVYGVEKP